MSDRVLNLHTFSDEASANEYTGGDAELTVVVPDDGSEPALRIHDGVQKGGYEIGCKCNEGECSDACKQYVDDAVRNIVVGGAPAVIGIVLAQEGGGAGVWQRVDINGQPIEVPDTYFNYHPIYRAIHRVTIDGQVMQEHKKFWFKAMEIQDGPYQGKIARMISPYKVDESWKAFPSFMKNGKEIDTWWCGTYQASSTTSGGVNYLRSVPGVIPVFKQDFLTFQAWAENRNTVSGVTGFAMWDFYQLAEIQLLALIEAETSDFQSFYGMGEPPRSSDSDTTPRVVDKESVATATWRGHVGLWGNIWQMCDGLGVLAKNGNYCIWDNTGNRTLVDTGIKCITYTDGQGHYEYTLSLSSAHGDNWDFNEVFLPAMTTISIDTGSIPDIFVGYPGITGASLYVGGSFTTQTHAWMGPFAYYLYRPSTIKNFDIGTRISKTPDPEG